MDVLEENVISKLKKIWYDKEEDILNIELDKGLYWKNLEIGKYLILDITKEGKITGIEILRASKVFPKEGEVVLERA